MVTIEKILDIHLSPSIPHLPAKEPVPNTVSKPFKLRNEGIYSQLCVFDKKVDISLVYDILILLRALTD